MGFWRFNGSTDYMVSSAAPVVLAAPVGLICLARIRNDPSTFDNFCGAYNNTVDTHRYSLTTSSGKDVSFVYRDAAVVSMDAKTPLRKYQWAVMIAFARSSTKQAVLHNSMGTIVRNTSSVVTPTGINRFCIGREESNAPERYLNGDVCYVGVLKSRPTVEEINRLLAYDHPLFVCPHRLAHYWQARGAVGSSIPDEIGTLNLTPNGTPTFYGGGPYLWTKQQIVRAPLFGYRYRFRISAVDDWKEVVSGKLPAGSLHVVEARIGSGVIGLKVDGGTETTAPTT